MDSSRMPTSVHTDLKYQLIHVIEELRTHGYRVTATEGEIQGWHEFLQQGFTIDMDNHA